MKRSSILALFCIVFCFSCGSKAPAPSGSPTGTNPTPNASAASPGSALITQVVLASRLTLFHHPVEVVNQFPTANGAINAVITIANAPPNSHVRGVFTDAGSGKQVNDFNITTEGSQHVGNIWKYPALPVGRYKLDVYLNGTLERSVDFQVTSDATPAPPPPTPGTIGNCAPVHSELQPAGDFGTVGLSIALGVDAQGKATGVGRIFKPDTAILYAIAKIEKTPSATRFGVRWYATDIGGVEPCDTEIADYETTVPAGSAGAYAGTRTPNGEPWPEGIYRAELYLNGTRTLVTDFGICAGPCKFKVPLAWTLP